MGGAAALTSASAAPSATVSFGLLAAVQLLSATAFLALGVASVWPRLRRRGAFLLLGAAVVLAVPEILTGCRFGNSSGTLLSGARCAGAVLLAAALYQGALTPGRDRADDDDTGGMPGSGRILRRLGPATGGAAVLSPLGASAPVAWLAAAAFAGAATLAWSRPLRLRIPLMSGLLLCGAAELLAPAARTSSSAGTQLLLLRGLGAVCLLAVLVALARASVLGRVATVIFSAVLLTAVGAVAVAGTVAASTLEREQSDTARRLQAQAQTELDGQVRRAETTARQAATCPGGPAGCPNLVSRSGTLVEMRSGTVRRASGADDAVVLAALPHVPIVATALRASGSSAERSASQLVVVPGRPNRLLVVAVSGADATGTRAGVVVPVDLRRLQSARTADLAVLLLPSGQIVGSTFGATFQQRLTGLMVGDAQQVLGSDPTDPAVLAGLNGRGRAAAAPVAAVASARAQPGGPQTAVLAAASRDDGLVKTQRRVLAGLFLALAATAVCVGLLGVLLGAGVVRPIRRVTEAARRVRAGEQATAGPGGSDELGELARAFDAMTTSLTGAQDELRRTAEREASTRAHLSVVLDSLGDGLLVVDVDERITDSNPAARSLLAGDPIGQLLGDVLPDGNDVVVATGGAPRYLSVRRTPLAGGGGTVVLLRDRTREREAERMKTEFLANVSHELRTPLTPVRGYAELLRRRRNARPEEVAEHAGVIASAADRMSRVVDLLVDVAALDAGRVSPSVAPMPLLPFLAERASVWRSRRPDRAGDLGAPATERLPPVLADGRWLAKAVDELIDNALKHTPAGTRVTVEAHRLDGRVRVGVRDEGPGLDDAARAALYDDFAQADGSVTRAKDGLGLGLPFVRRVAALFEFELVVESRSGAGAFFGLDVPVAPRPLPQRAARGSDAGAGTSPPAPDEQAGRQRPAVVRSPAVPAPSVTWPASPSGSGSGTPRP